MADALLWSLEETARQLGDVSTRTVRRMIDRREIFTKKVGRRRMVIAASVRAWLDEDMTTAHTVQSVGRDVQGVKACQKHAGESRTASTVDRIRRTTGPASSIRAAKELADLLAPKATKKRKQFSPSGKLK